MKYLNRFILIVTCIFNIGYAATVELTSASPSELAANYLRCINPGVRIPRLETPQKAFEYVGASIITEIPDNSVTHSGSGFTYGKSFTKKNQEPISFVTSLLSCRCDGAYPNIADIGCGLGLSAVLFMSEVITTYKKNECNLARPIHFDLYDINPAHQQALQALAALVNAAYPEYFCVTAAVHDVTTAPLPKDYYHVVLAFNVMHYIPEVKWNSALTCIEDAMKTGAMLLITTDYAECPETGSVFFSYGCTLYHSIKGLEKGVAFFNEEGIEYLKNTVECIPGKSYPESDMDISKCEEIFRANANIGEYKLLQNLRAELKKESNPEGEMLLYAGPYGFTEDSLKRAVKESKPESRLHPLDCPIFDLPTFGMIFVKR